MYLDYVPFFASAVGVIRGPAGTLDVVTDTVLRLTGHEPMTLPEFLEAHPESWAHLVLDELQR